MAIRLTPLGSAKIDASAPDCKPYFVVSDNIRRRFYVLSGIMDPAGSGLDPSHVSDITPITYTNGHVAAGKSWSLSEPHNVIAIDETRNLAYGGPFETTADNNTIKVYDIAQNFQLGGTIPLPVDVYGYSVSSLAVYYSTLVVGLDPQVGPTVAAVCLMNLADPVPPQLFYIQDTGGAGLGNFSRFENVLYFTLYNSAQLCWIDLATLSTGQMSIVDRGPFGPFPNGSAIDPANKQIYIPFEGAGGKFMKIYDVRTNPPQFKKQIPLLIDGNSIDIDTRSHLIYMCDSFDDKIVLVDTKADHQVGSVQPPVQEGNFITLDSLAVNENYHVVCTVSQDEKTAFVYQQS